MPTEARRPTVEVVERYRRRSRWLHAGVYLTVLTLLATGGWLLVGREGEPSPLSLVAGLPDTQLHVWVGWVFVGLVGLGIGASVRGALWFIVESLRYERSDLAWFRAWPRALLTGRFPWHGGHFDPGQRVANLAMLAALVTGTVTGAAMALLHGGRAFVWLVPLHRWSTYVLIPLLVGHVVIASGVLPGYRGVWRSMHLGGRLRTTVARRVWPGWTEQRLGRRD